MNDLLVRLVGWRALTFQGDPLVGDRWRWLKKHLEDGPGRVLDAGCGNGAFSFYAARRGNTVLGLTFSDGEVQKDNRRAALLRVSHLVDFRRFDLRQLDQAIDSLGRFDQVICLEVIEHVVNDGKLIRDLAALLAPGGRLLLSTPYEHYRRLYGETLSASEDGGHVRWGYTHETLQRLFAAAGLKVEREEYLGGLFSQKITDLMRRLERLSGRLAWAVTLPLRPLVMLDLFVTRLVRYPWMTVGVVGRKPVG
jgi:2-polyprenyl-3-methyl-5-hydroxy-6-metoxy-1,4-benzoquinol methylase